MRRTFVLLAGTALVLAAKGTAPAKINPNFTPIQLVQQSKLILVLDLSKPDAAKKALGRIREVVKGKTDAKTVTLDLNLGKGMEAVAEAAVRRITGARGEPALLFTGEFEEEGGDQAGAGEPLAGGYLHVGGKWLSLTRLKDGSWGLLDIDAHMEATWAGGTDMLLRCVKYVLSSPEPDVPVASGTSWDRKEKIADLTGRVRLALPVDLDGSGRLALFLAGDAGDRLFEYDRKKGAFREVTAGRGLSSRSAVAVFGDFNGDRRLDLASFDGKALKVYYQDGAGSFKADPVVVPLEAGCLDLAVLDVGVKGKAGLLVTTDAAVPLLLVPRKDGTFQAKPLAEKPPETKKLGKPAGCLVADLDGDGLADVLQPFEKGSFLYRGRGVGAFAGPTPLKLALGEAPAQLHAADYDQDGLLDVFVAAQDFCKIYQNLGKAYLVDRMDLAGEMTYISKPSAIGAQVCDINNDGRQDVFIFYRNLAPQLFFSRGFRSFGHAHSLDLAEQGLLEEANGGVQTGLVADFNGDGAQDMVVVTPDGRAWIFWRAVYLEAALAVRAVLPPGGPYAGPLTVTGKVEGRSLGAWNVVAGSSEAFLGRIDAGPLEFRWTFPGGKPQKKEVILESGPVREVLKPAK